jgi:alpha-glucosidase
LQFQDDKQAIKAESQFLFGDNLLIAPVTEADAKTVKVYLPAGIWYDFWNHQKYSGKQTIEIPTSLDHIPIFVRGGAILPSQPKMQYTDEFVFETLTLDLYFADGQSDSSLYEDSGDGFSYKEDDFSLKNFNALNSESAHIIRQNCSGEFKTTYKKYRLNFYGYNSPKMIMIDGNNSISNLEQIENGFSLILDKGFKEIVIS